MIAGRGGERGRVGIDGKGEEDNGIKGKGER